ncbi:MARCH5 [Branchiostoma lanceolatum]|uniref:MARCH5 protein n=1 Tax=Branchiostoma lanceolatum TaxID=7740 RepID=A0A8K0AAY6_BRALA|nr:MARCH5 [Branchiostoma lanceolatum]
MESILGKLLNLTTLMMGLTEAQECRDNCSEHGVCYEGRCICDVQFTGEACDESNMSYFIGFGFVFYFLVLVSSTQLVLCVRSEFQRQKEPSLFKACKMTTQKMLYLLTLLAAASRAAYFTAQEYIPIQWALNLMSAYYPLLITGSSLVVCVWAETFHVKDVLCDRPRFLNKSFAFFVVFNAFVYILLIMQFVLSVVVDHSMEEYLVSVFQCCFGMLMILVLIFFLIYGVEMFFKVHGAFASRNNSLNLTQLHMSRLGLVFQAGLQLFTALLLIMDMMGKIWKDSVPLVSNNYYTLTFRIVELGVVLWFPCVLWNVTSPEQLWILNPKQLLKKRDLEQVEPTETDSLLHHRNIPKYHATDDSAENDESLSEPRECWICYDPDKTDAGEMIQPCNCKGDVSAVHHDCLKRWLAESMGSGSAPRCKVCKEKYQLREGTVWLPSAVTVRQWLIFSFILVVMSAGPFIVYLIFRSFASPVPKILVIGGVVLLEYVCLKLLGFNCMTVYQQARLSALRILGRPVPAHSSVPQRESSEDRSPDTQQNIVVVEAEVHVGNHV